MILLVFLLVLTETIQLTIEFHMACAPTEKIRSSKIQQEIVDEDPAGCTLDQKIDLTGLL